ncbi:MAG: hypothetical protein GY821_07675 [Gammaproteobacteria bacterium]|nr:hypothetical protein [Gammaproteobacteria bacterium]
MIGNDRQFDEWYEEDDPQNLLTMAQNQSSRQEDELNETRQEQRTSSRDNKKQETAVQKEARRHSKGREDKKSQDARKNNNGGTNNTNGEMNFWNQNHRPASNQMSQPNMPQQQNMQQSPTLNLSQPPNAQQQPKMQQQAQSTQFRPGGQGPQYEDRSHHFTKSAKSGQAYGASYRSKSQPPLHSTPNVRAEQRNTGQGPTTSNNNNQIPSTSRGQQGQVNAGYAPAPKTVNFAEDVDDGNRYRDQNDQFCQDPNQNPPFPLQYEDQGFTENFVLDDEGGGLFRERRDGRVPRNHGRKQIAARWVPRNHGSKQIAAHQWSRSERYGTNGSFLGKSDTVLPFPMVSERYDDEFPLKMAPEIKNRHFWVKNGPACDRIIFAGLNRFCSVMCQSIGNR